MVDIWSIKDTLKVENLEAQIRGLNRRIAELDTALRDTQELLRIAPDNFAIKLSGMGLLKMQSALQGELVVAVRYRENEEIKIVLDGQGINGHSADVLSLSVILNRFQRLYSSIAHAIHNGPTIRGPLANAILRATNLRLQSTYPSSFGMNIYVPSSFDLLGNSISIVTLDSMFDLLGSTNNDEAMMQKASEVGARSMRHLKALAKHLEASGTEFSIGWKDYSGIQHAWKIDTDKAARVVKSIDKIAQTKSELKEISGRLVGASLFRDRFEIMVGDNLYEGKFVATLNEKVQELFGQDVVAMVEETEITDLVSNETRTYFTLTELNI